MSDLPSIKVRRGPSGFRLLVDGKVRKRGKQIWPLMEYWREELDLVESDEHALSQEYKDHYLAGTPVAELKPLDRTVWLGMTNYPTLFERRLDVLHHLYLILGNGYDWHNGILSENSSYDRMSIEMDYSDLLTPIKGGIFEEMIEETIADFTIPIASKNKTIKEFGIMVQAHRETAERDRKEKTAVRKEIETNLFQIVTTPDRTGILYSDGYGTAMDVVGNLDGRYGLRNVIPHRIERSHYEGLLEVLDAVIRGSHPDTELPIQKWNIQYRPYTRQEKIDACEILQEYRDSLPGSIEVFDK